MMSIFSSFNSCMTARTRCPIGPMQAPLALTSGLLLTTAILLRWTGLTGHGLDLDRPVGQLRHLELEELLHQSGVSAGDDDLRAADFLAHRDDIDPDPSSVRVALAGHLFGQRHDGLDLAEVNQHGAAVTALLHDSGDDVTL